MSPREEKGPDPASKRSRFVKSGPQAKARQKAQKPASAPVPLPPPLPPSGPEPVIPGVPNKLLADVERLAQKKAHRKAVREGKGVAPAPERPCEPGKKKKGAPLQPSCDTIEPSHIKPRGEAMLRSRFAAALLIIVLILGMVNALMVINEGLKVKTPQEMLTEESGTVYGRVTDIDGVGIPEAQVSIVGTTYRATTDLDGWYFIESVPVKVYKVQADKANFTSVLKKVRVEEQMSRPTNFQLSKGSGIKEVETNLPSDLGDLQSGYALSAVANLIGSAFAGAGAYLCIVRRRFVLALVCAAAGALSYGFLVGSALSVISLMLIVSARPGFVPKMGPFRVKTSRGSGEEVPQKEVGAAEGSTEASADDELYLAEEGPEVTLERPDGEGPNEQGPAVSEPQLRGLSTKKAEQEITSKETRQRPQAPEEPVIDAEVKESLRSKGYESEGGVADIDGEIDVVRKRKELRPVGPDVVPSMEQALKETMAKEGEGDIVASVLKKLELDKPVPSVKPPKKAKRKELKEHQERLLCRVCVKPIIMESEAVRCKCGRTYHIHCAKGIRDCKNCGRPLKFE